MHSVTKWRWGLVCVGLLPILMCIGCGKQPDLPEAPGAQDGEITERGATERPSTGTLPATAASGLQDGQSVAAPNVQLDAQPPASDTPPIPIRVAALIQQLDGDVRVGLVSENEQQHAVVGIGDRFMGYQLVAADAGKGEVVLQRDDNRYVLGVERSALPAALRSAAAGGDERQPTAPVLSGPPIGEGSLTASDMGAGVVDAPLPEPFKPTPKEKKLGIDPNDSSTWKPGYLGPGIERAAAAQPTYEPTPEEVQKGIDPNEPSTWPAEYRGPGIERVAAEQDEQTQELDYEDQ